MHQPETLTSSLCSQMTKRDAPHFLEVLFFGASGSEVESVEESSRDPGTLRGADVHDMLGATTRPMDGKRRSVWK